MTKRGRALSSAARWEWKASPLLVEPLKIKPKLDAGSRIHDWTAATPGGSRVVTPTATAMGASVPSASDLSSAPWAPPACHGCSAEAFLQVASDSSQPRFKAEIWYAAP